MVDHVQKLVIFRFEIDRNNTLVRKNHPIGIQTYNWGIIGMELWDWAMYKSIRFLSSGRFTLFKNNQAPTK